jgi:hypothetical protein
MNNKKIRIFFILIFLIGFVSFVSADGTIDSNQTWLNFDGVNNYVGVPTNTANTFNKNLDYTFSAWVYPKTNQNPMSIYSLGQFERGGIAFGIYSTGDLFIMNLKDYSFTRFGTVERNKWSFVSCVYYGGSKSVSCYINGFLSQIKGDTFNWSSITNSELATGRIGGGQGNFPFNGSINRVNLFNKAFSSLEIKDLYQSKNSYFNYTLNYSPSTINSKIIYQYDSLNYYVFLNGYLEKSNDGGKTWKQITGLGERWIETIFIDSHKNIFLTEYGTGNILRSNMNNDSEWSTIQVMSCLNKSREGFGYGTEWGFTETKDGSLLIGEYFLGNDSIQGCPYIHKSTDEGLTWKLAYDGNTQYPESSGRHIHLVKTDPYTGYVYATVGDYPGISRLLRSVDNGDTWTTIEQVDDTSQYLSLVFTPKYRIFGTDKGQGNKIIRTSDDVNFETVYTLPDDSDGYFWSMKRDEKTGFIIAGTLTTHSNKISTTLISPDNGTSWYSFYSFKQNQDYKGITMISNFDSEGNAYFWDNNLSKSFKFNFNTAPQKIESLAWFNFDEGSGTTAYDSSGNRNNGTIHGATWNDIIAPTITLIGLESQDIEVGSVYSDLGATADDNVDGNVTSSINTTETVNTTAIGSYNVIYTVTDSAGNTAIKTRTVKVVDTAKPVINLIGDNSTTIYVRENYTELGANVNDNYDTGLIATINHSGVDTSTVGSYFVTYDVTDSSGNKAEQVSRTVNVIAKPSSDSSGGGGSGYCTTQWTCSDWGTCFGNVQTRKCSYPENYCTPQSSKPAIMQSCTTQTEENTTVFNPNINQSETVTTTNFFTGAVTGIKEFSKTSGGTIYFLVVGILVIGGAVTFFTVKKRFAKKSKKVKKRNKN